MEVRDCINFMLTRAQQNVLQIFKERLQQFGLTPIQYAILKSLWAEDGMAPKDLAEAVYVDRPALTGILDRLESKKLIVRVPDAQDRRALRVFLTEDAKRIEAEVNTVVEGAHYAALHAYSVEEREMLLSLLRRLT